MHDSLMTIQEVSELSGLSPHTLRYYDQIGLVQPCARSAAGYRLYGQDDLARLRNTVVWRNLGFPLSEIRSLLHASSSPLADVLGRQLAVATAQASRFTAI